MSRPSGKGSLTAMRTPRKDLAARVEAVVALAKRRGFVFASSEIYGGTRSAWDYGPLGVALKENIRRAWWQSMVRERPEVVGLDSAIILAPEVWRASGHLEAFVDPLTECRSCHRRWRADHLLEAHAERHGEPPPDLSVVTCPHCGVRGQFTETRMFNGLLQTQIGPVADAGAIHYLRPETAQGIFVNFTQVMTAARRKPPFGIAQVGKSFRNEITPGNFIFRTREFEQMEMEYFVPPGTDEQWHEYWIEQRWRWYTDLGLREENLRRFEHPREKLSHYAKRTVDIEYRFGFAGSEWAELEGIANRTDFDLRTHSEHSGSDLSYFDQQTGTRWTPYVIEPAAGLTRAVLAFLLDAYDEDEAPTTKGGMDRRLVLRLNPRLAPVTAAVLPLSRHADLSGVAERLAAELSRQFDVELDDAGAIGRRYRRADEVGTPFAITVDFETAADGGVTIRERDSMAQVRVPIEGVRAWLAERMWPAG